jgi:hypothetical protein
VGRRGQRIVRWRKACHKQSIPGPEGDR